MVHKGVVEKELPKGWVETCLGNLYDFKYGKGLTKGARNETGQYKVYGSNGAVGYHDEFLVKGPVIIVGRKGAAGELHLSESDCWPIDTTYFIEISKLLSVEFSFYMLKSLRLSQFERSTAIPGLNRNDAYALEIKLPPLPEQRRIVAKIEELFSDLAAGVQSLETARAQLKRYRQSVLKHAFEGKLTEEWRRAQPQPPEPAQMLLKQIKEERDRHYRNQLDQWEQAVTQWQTNGKPGKKPAKPKQPKELPPLTDDELKELPELPKKWAWEKNENFLSEVKDGTHYTPKYVDFGIPFITQKNIKNNGLDSTNTQYISQEDHDKFYARSNVEKNDVIISMIGHGRGNCGLVDTDKTFSIKNVGLFKFFHKFQSNKYCMYYYQSTGGKNSILKKSKGGAQPFIGLTELRNWPIPVCSCPEQNQIVQEIESRLSVCDKLEEAVESSLKKAESLRQSILKKAFEGKLVPQDPNDEPAQLLLERIEQEKVSQAPAPKRKPKPRKNK